MRVRSSKTFFWQIDKLLHNFNKKLIFVGLQGSYPRGEATEESDFAEEDILQSIKIETANLYHYLCHLYVHGNFDTLDEELKQAYKSAFL
jgi:predicted nucleotidyltransferase